MTQISTGKIDMYQSIDMKVRPFSQLEKTIITKIRQSSQNPDLGFY